MERGEVMRSLSKIRGSLLGGAAGDALGYSVEFLDHDQIVERYGAEGILGYDLTNNIALISDDTQMTLFTANALLLAKTRRCMRGIEKPYEGYLALAYLDWVKTQHRFQADGRHRACCWLYQVPELHHRRAPGSTCMQALENRSIGTIDRPCNDSKGCGGIMRAAPIGLYFDPKDMPQREIDRLGAASAAITHGHVMGWLPAAAFVHMVSRITYGDAGVQDLNALIEETNAAMAELFGEVRAEPLAAILRRAQRLASSNIPDLDAIRLLGQGWVAEETLAIALFCLLRYPDCFGPCLIAAVNHDGDSDSTGAVAGNLLGALLGAEYIPEFYLDSLELRPVIEEIARDLWTDCPMTMGSSFFDEDWSRKYIECRYDPL